MAVPNSLELWGGLECTVNRVGDHYFDQLEWSGHHERIEDLDLFARLGFRNLRYPFLWEKFAPEGLTQPNWQWAEERIARAEKLNLSLIAGLVHHGSGPKYTSLLDLDFPKKLADYAFAFAQKFPQIDR